MAQISILVKKEGIISKYLSIAKPTTTIWNVKKKMKEADHVIVQIDDNTYTLEASEKPHIIILNAGKHVIAAADVNGDSKRVLDAVFRAAAYGGASITGGSSIFQNIARGLDSANESHARAAEHSFDEFEIAEEETIKYECQATAKGVVKVKRIW